MTLASIELHIGRVVWHGGGAPDAQALAAAIEAAVASALAQQPAAQGAGTLAHAGEAVAKQLLPALAEGAR
jgi:hypothetical protein